MARKSCVQRKWSPSSARPANTAVTGSVDDWTADELLGGKSAADMQEGIEVNNNRYTISGTLKYVTGYTDFSGSSELQSGNFLAVKFESSNGGTVRVYYTRWATLDDDGIVVCRVTDRYTPLIVEATVDGQTNLFSYDLSNLVLESA